jgi:hypothetical protein
MLSCWWNWFFGGSFGARGFTQHIAFLSLPLAATCDFFLNTIFIRKILHLLKALFFVFIFSGICLNVGQSYQYVQKYIHYDAMTKKAYWYIFGRYYLDEKDKGELWSRLKIHDDKALRSGANRDQ